MLNISPDQWPVREEQEKTEQMAVKNG